ncbi:UNVERIFIED_CONTAM: hypothetical protein RMT77_001179 [Armadillidium vulgare]|nr:Death-associated protein 1 [Armadillidium vulgare]
MSSNPEPIETKAGHPPALKVGGMRVAQRQRRDSEETSKPKEKNEKADDSQGSFNMFKPPVLVTVQKDTEQKDQKDVVKAEIKHAHEKPVPTHQPVHQNKPSVIQQPRK